MKIMSSNALKTATITASSENELFPLENLYSARRVKYFQFTGSSSEWVKVYKSGLSFNAAIIDSHNLTSSATVKFQANATDSWTSPIIDITMTVKETMAYTWSASQSYDYFRVTIEDPTNTEAVKLGIMFIDNAYSLDIRHNWSLPDVTAGRTVYKTLDGSFPYLDVTDKANLDTIKENVAGTIQLSETRQQFGTAQPFYAIIDEDNLDNPFPLYCITDGFQITRKKTAAISWDGSFSFEEVN